MTFLDRMRAFEMNASIYALTMDALNIRMYDTKTVKVSLHAVDMSTSRTTSTGILEDDTDKQGSRITIPTLKVKKQFARKLTGFEKLFVLIAWWKDKSDLPRQASVTIPTNSSILTISYFAKNRYDNFEKYSMPVKYYIDLRQDFTTINTVKAYESLEGIERQCAWLDLNTSTWETRGCIANVIGKGVNCECNHTTTFVTLLLANTHEEIPHVVYKITLTMQIISIICLFLTIIFIAIARHGTGIDSSSFAFEVTGMNANRTNSQISLCVALLFMHIFSIIGGWIRSQSDHGCVATALLTQYFLLASAHWSLSEGLGIFAKMSSYLTMKIEYRSMTWIQIFVGWCMPLIITTITAAYGLKSDRLIDKSCSENGEVLDVCAGLQFQEYKSCWLGKESGMVWAAIGPLVAILLLNIAIFIYVTVTVVKIKRNQPKVDFERSNTQCATSTTAGGTLTRNNGNKSTLEVPANRQNTGRRSTAESSLTAKRRISYIVSVTRSFGILMPILGIPWIFGILANIESAGVALSSMHAVVNGLQGFILFLLYCVSSKRDLKIVKRKWRNSHLKGIATKRKYSIKPSIVLRNPTAVPEPRDNSRTNSNETNCPPVSQYDTLSSCRSSNGTVISSLSSQKNDNNNKSMFSLLNCIRISKSNQPDV